MKKIQNLCAAMTLLIVLSMSAVAGEITTGATSPQPTPTPSSVMRTAPADINTDSAIEPTQTDLGLQTLVTEITLRALQLLWVL